MSVAPKAQFNPRLNTFENIYQHEIEKLQKKIQYIFQLRTLYSTKVGSREKR